MDLAKQIESLYWEDELSALEVGHRLSLSKWQVFKHMRKYNIPRRTPSQTQKIQFLKSPLSYSKKTTLTSNETLIYTAGLMLYWAEGSKRNKHTVDFANSDPKMILLYMKMLRMIYKVNESKLRVLLYCYSNQEPKRLLSYWSKLLNIPSTQFSKPYV